MTPEKWVAERIQNGSLTLSDVVLLFKVAQEELNVSPDGKPGAKTMAALTQRLSENLAGILRGKIEGDEIPKGRDATLRYYGNPSWVRLSKGRAVDIDDKWERANIRWFQLHTGKKVRMHRLAGAEFVELFKEACEKSGYTPKSVQTYVPRVIGGTMTLSMHALGAAVDFDSRLNPWGGMVGKKLSKLRQHPEFVAVFENAGWRWGGRWKDPKSKKRGWGDDMHFERRAPTKNYAGTPINTSK